MARQLTIQFRGRARTGSLQGLKNPTISVPIKFAKEFISEQNRLGLRVISSTTRSVEKLSSFEQKRMQQIKKGIIRPKPQTLKQSIPLKISPNGKKVKLTRDDIRARTIERLPPKIKKRVTKAITQDKQVKIPSTELISVISGFAPKDKQKVLQKLRRRPEQLKEIREVLLGKKKFLTPSERGDIPKDIKVLFPARKISERIQKAVNVASKKIFGTEKLDIVFNPLTSSVTFVPKTKRFKPLTKGQLKIGETTSGQAVDIGSFFIPYFGKGRIAIETGAIAEKVAQGVPLTTSEKIFAGVMATGGIGKITTKAGKNILPKLLKRDFQVEKILVALKEQKKIKVPLETIKGKLPIDIAVDLPKNIKAFQLRARSKVFSVPVNFKRLRKVKDLGEFRVTGNIISKELTKNIPVRLKGVTPTEIQELIVRAATRKGQKTISVGKLKIEKLEGKKFKEIDRARIVGLTTQTDRNLFRSLGLSKTTDKKFITEDIAKKIGELKGIDRKADVFAFIGESSQATLNKLIPGTKSASGGFQFVIKSRKTEQVIASGGKVKVKGKTTPFIIGQNALENIIKQSAKKLKIPIKIKSVKLPKGKPSVAALTKEEAFDIVGQPFKPSRQVTSEFEFSVTKPGEIPKAVTPTDKLSIVSLLQEAQKDKSIQGLGIQQLNIQGLTSKEKLKFNQVIKAQSKTGIKEALDTSLKELTKERLKERTKLKIGQKLKTKQITIKTGITKAVTTPKIPKAPLVSKRIKEILAKIPKGKSPGWVGMVKQGGKFRPVTSKTTKFKAGSKAQRITDNTISAQYKIVQRGLIKKVSAAKNKFTHSKKFRPFEIRLRTGRFKRALPSEQFIEKRTFRLDSAGEKAGIKAFPRKKKTKKNNPGMISMGGGFL